MTSVSSKKTTLQRDVDLILKELMNSRNYFKKDGSEFGIAKTNLIEAEF